MSEQKNDAPDNAAESTTTTTTTTNKPAQTEKQRLEDKPSADLTKDEVKDRLANRVEDNLNGDADPGDVTTEVKKTITHSPVRKGGL